MFDSNFISYQFISILYIWAHFISQINLFEL